MQKTIRWLFVAMLAVAASWGPIAAADVANEDATNVQEGDNENETTQDGEAASGDAVAGQVVGVGAGGDTSVDATNHSEDVDVETGDVHAENFSDSFVGLTPGAAGDTAGGGAGGGTVSASDIFNADAINVQEGDNEYELDQEAEASSGDGVAGQVIGVVTTWGGSADVVASNASEDVDVDTGDVEAENFALAFVGLFGTGDGAGGGGAGGGTVSANDILNLDAVNVHEGDNDLDASQDAEASSGDGVGGQVIGIVSAGDASVDATNRSEDVEIDTADADAFNAFVAFVGVTNATATLGGLGGEVPGFDVPFGASDVVNLDAVNVQEGDNGRNLDQDADSATGDGVAGQVVGVGTSAGGSADLVLSSESVDSEVDTGESDFQNFDVSFTGLNASGVIEVV